MTVVLNFDHCATIAEAEQQLRDMLERLVTDAQRRAATDALLDDVDADDVDAAVAFNTEQTREAIEAAAGLLRRAMRRRGRE